MRKIEGLKFLQRFFSDVCVDCVFVTASESFNVCLLENHAPQLFRVRSGRVFGSELSLPQRTCHSVEEVCDFISKTQAQENGVEFVIHRVDESYFEALYVGTIALFDKPNSPMIIDFQSVSLELVAGIDTGTRPRDWKVAATFIYPFLGCSSAVQLTDPSFQADSIKEPLYRLWHIGRKVDSLKQSFHECYESVVRFNVYSGGRVLLDDYRSMESFYRRGVV